MDNTTNTENAAKQLAREYTPNRFEFTVYVNDFVICRRNFKINFFNEQSFYSMQMKNQLDNIVNLINNDLKSKSRLYTWYYFNEEVTDDEFHQPLIEPWECTFKFQITDNGKEVLSKIWDGRFYPKSIREKVDLTNKFIEMNGYKMEIAKLDMGRLTMEGYVNLIIMNNRQDLVSQIIKMICEVCSPQEVTIDENGKVNKSGDFSSEQDYELSVEYNTIEPNTYKKLGSKKYTLSRYQRYMKLCSDLATKYNDKTKHYFEVEMNNFYNPYKFKRY